MNSNYILLVGLFLINNVKAQYGPGGFGGGGFGGGGFGGGGFGRPGFNSGFGSFNGGQWNNVLTAHAVMAALVWVILMPTGAIFMRLNLKSPWILRLHAIWQIFSFIIYVVAVGMGIWLIRSLPFANLWNDPHPKLGLAILGLAFLQPIFGAIHHNMFKKNSTNFQSGQSTKPPGRTIPGYIHLWLGRSLIILGMINGGLGIRFVSNSQMQSQDITNKAAIAYGVIAGFMFLLYFIITIIFEIRRSRSPKVSPDTIQMKNTLPSYDESQESLRTPAPKYQ